MKRTFKYDILYSIKAFSVTPDPS